MLSNSADHGFPCLLTKPIQNEKKKKKNPGIPKMEKEIFQMTKMGSLPVAIYMPESRKFCQRGSNFDNFFSLVLEGREDPNTTISGP